jgi:Zn-dependent protease with chaperone function
LVVSILLRGMPPAAERAIAASTIRLHLTARRIAMNYVRTAILLAVLTALVMVLSYLLGGPDGVLVAFLTAAATNFLAYWKGDRLVLSMHGVQEVESARRLSLSTADSSPRCSTWSIITMSC